MSDLIEKLRLACDDPMWADHVEMPKKLLRHSIDYLDALKKQVEELTAERDAATISGWKAAIDCASYAAANTYGPRVDPAAVAKARDDLVQELLTASPGDYLDCCWKDAQDAIRAEAEAAALRKALIEARDVVDAVTGHNQPDRPWSRQVRDRIDAALASTKETSDAG